MDLRPGKRANREEAEIEEDLIPIVRSKFIPYKIYTYTVSLFIMIKGKEGFRHT